MQHILVISPHPDDESIGCGGTICTHAAAGDKVELIVLTSGEKGGHGSSEDETIIIREEEAAAAAAILGIANIEFWKQPDGEFNSTDENVNRLVEKIKYYHPSIIYVTHDKEMHPDHKAAARLVATALKSAALPGVKPIVWMYEVWTPIQQINHIVDISDHIDLKRMAIRAHASQCSVLKFDEAIIGLNRYRGEMHCWPGGDYAEVFTSPLL